MASYAVGLFLSVVIFSTAAEVLGQQQQQFRRVCYFTNWSCDLLIKEAHFCLSDIDVKLCSHLIYAFVGVNVTSRTLEPSRVDDKSHDGIKGRYILFNELKGKNPNLKTLLSVGGSSHSGLLDNVTSSPSLRKEFAYNSAIYARKWGFDGLDLDWEYPDNTQKEALTLLVKDLRSAFSREAEESGKRELILSLAAPPSEDRVKSGYEVDKISQYVDMINLMVYDFHGAWGDITGFNSPLYPRASDPRYSPKHCVTWTVNLWLTLGAPSSKINLGIAGYGQSFTLDIETKESLDSNTTLTNDTKNATDAGSISENPSPTTRPHVNFTCKPDFNCSLLSTSESNNKMNFMENYENSTYGVGSKAKGPGIPGRLRHLDGQLSYPEICEKIRHGATLSWNDEQQVPFMVDEDQWVGFDDVRSIAEKVKWAVEQNLGGVMFWSLDLDDFTGNYCMQGRYPLLSAISDTVASLGHSLELGHGIPNDTQHGEQFDTVLMNGNSSGDSLDKAVENGSNSLHGRLNVNDGSKTQSQDRDISHTSNQLSRKLVNDNNSSNTHNNGRSSDNAHVAHLNPSNSRRGKFQHPHQDDSVKEDNLRDRSRPSSNHPKQNEHSNNDGRSRVRPGSSRSEAKPDRRNDRRRQGRPQPPGRRNQGTSNGHRGKDETRQSNGINRNGNERSSANNFRRQRNRGRTPHKDKTTDKENSQSTNTRPTTLTQSTTPVNLFRQESKTRSGKDDQKISGANQGRVSTTEKASNPLDLFPHINVDDSDVANNYYYYIAFEIQDPVVNSTISTTVATTTRKPKRKPRPSSKAKDSKESPPKQSKIPSLGKSKFYNSATQLSAKITSFVAVLILFYCHGIDNI